MDQLKERILKEGKNIGNGILKVDGFINHQVDPVLMNEAGKEFARFFNHVSPTKILTAEISGIAPAVSTGLHMNLPVVFARKHKPITMPDQVLLTLSPSHLLTLSRFVATYRAMGNKMSTENPHTNFNFTIAFKRKLLYEYFFLCPCFLQKLPTNFFQSFIGFISDRDRDCAI